MQWQQYSVSVASMGLEMIAIRPGGGPDAGRRTTGRFGESNQRFSLASFRERITK